MKFKFFSQFFIIIIKMAINRAILLSAAIILEIYEIYNGAIKRNTKMKMLHQILQLIPIKPSQIIDKFKNHGSGPTLQICKGTIFAGETCTALLNSNQKIVFSKLIDGKIGYMLYPHRVLRIKQPSFLQITDEISKIKIFETHNTVIVPTKMISPQPQSLFFDKIKNAINYMFSSIEIPMDQNLNYAEFGGQNLKEIILPEGSQCAILGKFSVQSSEVNCFKPFLIAPSKQRMIALIQQDLLSSKLISFLLMIGTGVAIIFLLRQLWLLFKKYQGKSNDVFARLNKIFLKSRICSHCKKNMSCVLSKSCMHMTLCQQCLVKEGDTCSQCKKKIKETVQIFVC